jgi:DNA-repair protein complementing XP-A cells
MSKDGEHELIAKTEAKTTFLLKDHDLEEGEHGHALRYITRRNPHNPSGGEMKLYLRLQVEERAIKIWGSEVNSFIILNLR